MPIPLLAPVCDTPLRLRELAADPPPIAAPRHPTAAPEVCIDPTRLARSQDLSGTYDQTRDTDHFHIAWDAENTVLTEDLLDVYTQTLEDAWAFQIGTLGWQAPDQADTCLLTVLLADFSDAESGTGGYTDVEEEDGIPYIILNTDWAEYGDEWTETLAAHEFNHASQFGYGVFWDESDWWYWESTAEWSPYLYYDVPDVWMWSVSYYADAPWRALDSNTALSQYGHMVFNRYLSETWSDDVPRAIWATATADDRVGDALEAVLQNEGVTFEDVVLGFSSHAAALDVTEPEVWLESMGYFEIDDYTVEVDAVPAEGDQGDKGPQERGQSFAHFSGGPKDDVELAFAGEATVEGVDAEWALAIAAVSEDGTVTHTTARADALGAATVVLPLSVSTDVYVAFVPLGEIGEENASFTWTATPVLDEDDTVGKPAGDEEAPGGCGCATPTAPAGLLWLAAAVAVTRRRR